MGQSQPASHSMATVAVVSPDGVRHTVQIDQEYLQSHGIQITSNGSYNVSAIVLKQRIWEQWQAGMSSVREMDNNIDF